MFTYILVTPLMGVETNLLGWLAGLLACSLAGWLADWLAGWQDGWLAGWPAHAARNPIRLGLFKIYTWAFQRDRLHVHVTCPPATLAATRQCIKLHK